MKLFDEVQRKYMDESKATLLSNLIESNTDGVIDIGNLRLPNGVRREVIPKAIRKGTLINSEFPEENWYYAKLRDIVLNKQEETPLPGLPNVSELKDWLGKLEDGKVYYPSIYVKEELRIPQVLLVLALRPEIKIRLGSDIGRILSIISPLLKKGRSPEDLIRVYGNKWFLNEGITGIISVTFKTPDTKIYFPGVGDYSFREILDHPTFNVIPSIFSTVDFAKVEGSKEIAKEIVDFALKEIVRNTPVVNNIRRYLK